MNASERHKRWCAANHERVISNKREWRKANPDKHRGQRHRRRARYPEQFKAQQARYRERYRASIKAKAVAKRKEVIGAYGGKCACCGESEYRFLTLDHINGGGSAHRKETGSSKIWMTIPIDPPRLDLYQVLCWNCNCGRAFNGGICPHETRR